MITIKNEHKPLLNACIHYYRTHDTSEACLVKNFILNQYNIPICDSTTLLRLEANKTNGSEDVYFELLKKLNKLSINSLEILQKGLHNF